MSNLRVSLQDPQYRAMFKAKIKLFVNVVLTGIAGGLTGAALIRSIHHIEADFGLEANILFSQALRLITFILQNMVKVGGAGVSGAAQGVAFCFNTTLDLTKAVAGFGLNVTGIAFNVLTSLASFFNEQGHYIVAGTGGLTIRSQDFRTSMSNAAESTMAIYRNVVSRLNDARLFVSSIGPRVKRMTNRARLVSKSRLSRRVKRINDTIKSSARRCVTSYMATPVANTLDTIADQIGEIVVDFFAGNVPTTMATTMAESTAMMASLTVNLATGILSVVRQLNEINEAANVRLSDFNARLDGVIDDISHQADQAAIPHRRRSLSPQPQPRAIEPRRARAQSEEAALRLANTIARNAIAQRPAAISAHEAATVRRQANLRRENAAAVRAHPAAALPDSDDEYFSVGPTPSPTGPNGGNRKTRRHKKPRRNKKH